MLSATENHLEICRDEHDHRHHLDHHYHVTDSNQSKGRYDHHGCNDDHHSFIIIITDLFSTHHLDRERECFIEETNSPHCCEKPDHHHHHHNHRHHCLYRCHCHAYQNCCNLVVIIPESSPFPSRISLFGVGEGVKAGPRS